MTRRSTTLPAILSRFFHHHIRFAAALLLGVAVFVVFRATHGPMPIAAGGDAFFLSFLAMSWHFIFSQSSDDLDRRADQEDEGLIVVIAITLVAVAYSFIAIFTLLNQKHPAGMLPLVLAIAGAPLGWFTLHTISAQHYANVYYFGDLCEDGSGRALKFPETDKAGPSDFMYFSFVIGMTAQVSDVLVQTSQMRRLVMAHGIISFFFNTVLIAMVVNAAVATVQGA